MGFLTGGTAMIKDDTMSMKLPRQLKTAAANLAGQRGESLSSLVVGLIEREVSRVERLNARRRLQR